MIQLVWVFGPEEDSVPKIRCENEAGVAGPSEEPQQGALILILRKRGKKSKI
jgi:hypothetical protein